MPNIGICIPTAAPDVQPETVVQFGRMADDGGAHSIWTIDRLVWHNPEALTSLAAVAGATSRVKLGTCVLLAPLWQPLRLAKSVATIDYISKGRVILGLGVGSRADDFDVMTTPLSERRGRMDETIELLRQAWRGEPIKHRGEMFQIDTGPVGPRPVQGQLPIYVGGITEPALRRLVRVADGFIANPGAGLEGWKKNWPRLQEMAREAGRDPATIHPVGMVWGAMDDDRSRAEQIMHNYQNFYNRGRPFNASSYVVGSASTFIETGQEYFASGAETLIVGLFSPDLGRLDRFLSDVVPVLQR